ncbi:MAG: [protein-PII] uridylyltransferase, partial [Rhodobacteraceae bacterium]|nr:[protein-PII] uridylyltransferase [Paracoccaceae bacterium]
MARVSETVQPEPAVSAQTPVRDHPIFGPAAFCLALNGPLGATADARDQRALIVTELVRARTAALNTIGSDFLTHPREARATVNAYAALNDATIEVIFTLVTTVMHPLANPTEAERIAVMAVGGYGRAEMAPFSDIDLLFLTPWKMTAWAENVIESMLYILWDLKLKVGHASRTVKDCLRLGREDYTIRTALLERRFLIGHQPLAAELRTKLRDQLFKNTGAEFIEAKLEERAERHKRQGGQRYVLEPNVKEGKGGL